MNNSFRKIRFLLVWLATFCVMIVLMALLTPQDEMGTTNASNFHAVMLFIVPTVSGLVCSCKRETKTGAKEPDGIKETKDIKENIRPRPAVQSSQKRTVPLSASVGEKSRALKLLDDAKFYANVINVSADVSVFEYNYCRLLNVFDEMIFLNEERGVSMVPAPRQDLEKNKANMGNILDNFISRGINNIRESGALWADQVDSFLNSIEKNNCISNLLTAYNRERIRQLRNQAAAAREQKKIVLPLNPDRTAIKKQEVQIDYSQILRDEAEWRRKQYGLSPVESELERIDKMDGRIFEQWCAKLLQKSGFINVEVTRASGDQGVDVLATLDGVKYAVQCKCYSSDLGNKPVQEVYAGRAIYDCQVGSVMTNRYFTSGAKELAEATGVFLWDRDWITSLLEELDDDEFPL